MQEDQKKTTMEDSDESSQSSQSLLGKQEKHVKPLPPGKLPLISLIFLIYFGVSGGPYGQETTVGAAGPTFAIVGFVVFPILWSIPEALVVAELSTTFPCNGGYVMWTHEAFGPFWGFLTGSWKFLSGVMNMAYFSAFCLDYLDATFPFVSAGLPHQFLVFVSTIIMSLINFRGIKIVGYASIALGIVSLVPFLTLCVVAIPKIDPSNWILMGQNTRKKQWKLFFHTLFSNSNSWDSVSTLAAEVKKPHKSFPKALLISILFTFISSLLPLLLSIACISMDMDDWVNGYYKDIAELIAGTWLRSWIEIGAVVSSLGLFQAQLTNCSYQLSGMADIGLVPSFLGTKSTRYDTPWVGISVTSMIALSISYMNFENIISVAVFLYSTGALVVFSSFIKLRVKFPAKIRPFQVPIGTSGVVAMCSIPSVFLVYLVCAANATVYLASGSLTVFGIALYFLMKVFKARKLLHFNSLSRKSVDEHNLGFYDEIVK